MPVAHHIRVNQANLWIEGMLELVDGSDNGLAELVVNNMHPSSGFCLTTPATRGEQWGLVGKPNKEAQSLTPLYPSESVLHPYFDNLLRSEKPHYSAAERSIYMPGGKLSKEIGGVALLHGGVHAYAHRNGLLRDRGEWSRWVEEVIAFSVELGALRKATGSLYESHIKDLAKAVIDSGIKGPTDFVPNKMVTGLASVLTEKNCALDLRILRGAIEIQTVFFVLDNGFDLNDDIGRHAHHIRMLYGDDFDKQQVPEIRVNIPGL